MDGATIVISQESHQTIKNPFGQTGFLLVREARFELA